MASLACSTLKVVKRMYSCAGLFEKVTCEGVQRKNDRFRIESIISHEDRSDSHKYVHFTICDREMVA